MNRVSSQLLLILLFVSVGVNVFLVFGQARVPLEIKSTGPTVEELERLGEVVTTRVHIADVLTAEDPTYRGS